MVPVDDATQARFWTKVTMSDTGCWEWTGAKLPKGYGRFAAWSKRSERKCVYAHRYSYELHRGEIPEGKYIDHMCGRPSCVNPDHLQVVTPAENQHNIRGRGKYRGVSLSASGKWRARVMVGGKEFSFGSFDSEEDAAEAALKGRLQLYTHNAKDRGFQDG